MRGQTDRAQKAWGRSLAEAQKLKMLYEQALTHYEWGRHLPAGDDARRNHLIQAQQIFDQFQAKYDLERVNTLLGDKP
jgi:hypothetical protein